MSDSPLRFAELKNGSFFAWSETGTTLRKLNHAQYCFAEGAQTFLCMAPHQEVIRR